MASHPGQTTFACLEDWILWKQAFATAASSLCLPNVLETVSASSRLAVGWPQQENKTGPDGLKLLLEALDPVPVRRDGQWLDAYQQDIQYWEFSCSQAYLRNADRITDYRKELEIAR